MRSVSAVVMFFVLACGATSASVTRSDRTLPESALTSLPPRPDSTPIPEAEDWVVPLEAGDQTDRAGVLLSDAKARRAALWVVEYNRIRGLYEIDLVTWARERVIYNRYLRLADDEVARWQDASRRTWWERHQGQIGLGVGLVLGIVTTMLVVYGLDRSGE